MLTKELFRSPNLALLAAFFLSVSFWHINFSRIAFRGILVPFLLVWSFYFIFKAINLQDKKKNILLSIVCCLLSGFLFGLGFHTYIAFRMAVIIMLVPLIMVWVKFWKQYKKSGDRPWPIYFKKGFWRYDFWLVAILLAALPIGLYFIQNPQDFLGRAGGVSIFAQESPIKALVASTVKTLGMFNVTGDWNWRHNFAGSPQLLWPIGILFLIGFILSIKKLVESIKEKNCLLFTIYCLLFIWFAVMLLPAILTYEGIPHALRCIGAIPVCYIFAAFGAYAVYKFLYKFVESKKLNNSLLLVACFLFLFTCGYVQYDKYFMDWARQPDVENAFAKDYVEIGKYLNSLPSETARYVIVNQDGVLVKSIPMPAQTVMFVEEISQQAQGTVYLLPEEIDEIELMEKLVVIPLQYDYEIFKKLIEKFPEGELRLQESFWLFEI